MRRKHERVLGVQIRTRAAKKGGRQLGTEARSPLQAPKKQLPLRSSTLPLPLSLRRKTKMTSAHRHGPQRSGFTLRR
jgi:hypothetical protein